jgi:glycosyltransferase involved in cell wall biosynthesis
VNVLFVTAGLEAQLGGPVSPTISECLALERAGLSTVVAVLGDSRETDPGIDRLREGGVETIIFPRTQLLRQRSRRWGVSFSLAAWLARNVGRFDVVHTHGAWTLSTLAAVAAARWRRVPTVLTPHESLTEFDIAKSRWPARLVKTLLRRLYFRLLDVVLFSSELERRSSALSSTRAALAVVPLPVEMAELATPVARSGLVVGFLGRIDPKKNLPVLIDAMGLLSADVRLVIAGDGDPEVAQELRWRAETQSPGRIEWVGFLAADARARFFESIDVLAMPSAFECFGMSAAEALAAGVPVVVSPDCGIAETVERWDCGIIAPARADAFADALRSFSSGRTGMTKLRAKAQEAARAELSPASHARALQRVYER